MRLPPEYGPSGKYAIPYRWWYTQTDATISPVERPLDLSSARREALDRLVPREQQTGDLKKDFVAAGEEAKRRREQNTEDGGHVFQALHEITGSWAIVAYLVGLPKSTVINWSKKLSEIDEMPPETPETPPQS